MKKSSRTHPVGSPHKNSVPLVGELLPRKGAHDNPECPSCGFQSEMAPSPIQRTTKRVSVSERHFEATAIEETVSSVSESDSSSSPTVRDTARDLRPTFNLLAEPWLPVRRRSGTVEHITTSR